MRTMWSGWGLSLKLIVMVKLLGILLTVLAVSNSWIAPHMPMVIDWIL